MRALQSGQDAMTLWYRRLERHESRRWRGGHRVGRRRVIHGTRYCEVECRPLTGERNGVGSCFPGELSLPLGRWGRCAVLG